MLSHVPTDADVGRRIRQARVRAGHSSGIRFAKAVGLTQPTLSRIEAGKRSVNVLELARIASVLAQPPETFLEAEAAGGAFFRLPPGTELTSELDQLVRWLEKFAYRVHALREFTPQAEIPKPDVVRKDQPQTLEEAAIVAEDLRRFVGLGTGPASDMIEILERLGCLVMVRPERRGPDAVYVPSPLAMVLLNGAKPRVRQRFTLGHELAHHIFHGGFVTIDVDIHDPSSRNEQLCNSFAAHFLMPKSGIDSELQRRFSLDRPQRPEHAFWLANHFGVSLQAMCYQLQNLQLIAPATGRAWRDQDHRALGYSLGLVDPRQRPPVERRWPPEFLERLRFALHHHVLDRAQVKRHLESDPQAVAAVLAPA